MNMFKTGAFLALLALGAVHSASAQTPMITDGATSGTTADAAVNATWRPSLVRDGVYDREPHAARPLGWQPLRENDILWKKRVWREIDTREKQNMAFRYPGDESTGGGMFIEILLNSIKTGKLKAYSGFDDRFTSALTKDQIMEMLVGTPDTVDSEDPVTGQITRKIINKEFNVELVTKYRVKEDWVFDRNLGRMVCRIIGMAPMIDRYNEDGTYRTTTPLFWLYYPEAREVLTNYEVFNPENDIARMTWDEYFEGRMFSSRIYKVSNPFGASFTEQGLSNMEQLYEGQRAAEELFNREHDMWMY